MNPDQQPCGRGRRLGKKSWRSEEHTSELQSQSNLVCRLLLDKKKTLLTRITRTKNILHIYFTHPQVAIQNSVASNTAISESTLIVKRLNRFTRNKSKTTKLKR